MILPLLAMALSSNSKAEDPRQQALDVTKSITRHYREDKPLRFIEWVDETGKKSKDAAFAWDMGVLLAAAAMEMRVDREKGERQFADVYKALEPYGHEVKGGYAYATTPHQKATALDLYYDDNEWIGIALLEAYEIGGSKKYLRRAQQVFDWLKTGESNALGGGVFWHANARKEKNTCSNAPAIVYAMKLYRATHDQTDFDFAIRLHKWVSRFQDADGLYWDNEKLTGEIDKTKWTYNSALMIRANLEFSYATHEARYLAEAKRIGAAAREHWIDPNSGAIKDEAAFAHHLADAWLELDKVDPKGGWRQLAEKGIAFAFDHTRDKDGIFGHRWDAPKADKGKRQLLAQASMARACWHSSTPR